MKHVKNSLLWIPTILWYRVIWSFSAQNSQVSGDLSDRLLWRLMSFLSPSFGIGCFQAQNTAVEMLSFFERKAAHMFLYFVLILLLWMALLPLIRDKAQRTALAAALCAVLASLDEYHQLLVPGRSGQIRDICIDLTGAAAALLLMQLLLWTDRERHCRHRNPVSWVPIVISALLAGAIASPVSFGKFPAVFGKAQQFVPGSAALSALEPSSLSAALAPILREFCFLVSCLLIGFCAALSAALIWPCPLSAFGYACLLAILLSGMFSLLISPAIFFPAIGLALLGCVFLHYSGYSFTW